MRILTMQPERVFYYFEEISRIPRGSGNTKVELVAVNRRRIQSLFWEFQHCEPFTKALMSAIRQKGMGDGLLVGSQEYMGAIVGTLNILSDEELMVLAKGAAKNMLEALNPMFNLS